MLKDVVEVRCLGGHRLHLRFDDGVEGEVDMAAFLKFTGVFAPLRETAFFVQVRVHPELRVVCWPNGADLDSDVLYERITKKRISRHKQTTRMRQRAPSLGPAAKASQPQAQC